MPDYPRHLDFEARGNRRGLTFRAGSFYIVEGAYGFEALDEQGEAHLVKVLGRFDVFLKEAVLPEAVLLREAPSYPSVQDEHPEQPGNEILAFLKPPDSIPMSTEAVGFRVFGRNVPNEETL